MRKLLKQPWFVAVLAVGAIVFCTISLREQLGGGAGFSSAVATAPAPEALEVEDEESEATPVAHDARSIAAILAALKFPESIPDPFAQRGVKLVASEPAADATSARPDEKDTIQLSAVWEQSGVRLALVNNRIMRVGDRIGRLTIDEVTMDGIWISHWKGRDFVPFGSEFTLLTPAAGDETAIETAPSLALHEK